MLFRSTAAFFVLVLPSYAATFPLNGNSVDLSVFEVTEFAQNVFAPLSVNRLGDGSVLVASGQYGSAATVNRYVDANHDGVADAPGAAVYTKAGGGPVTGLVESGGYYFLGTSADHTISILQPGASPADSLTAIGDLQFNFPAGWLHDQMGIAVRQDAAQPNLYDLVFNIGSQYNAQLSDGKVTLSGLTNAILDGDSLYSIRLHIDGSSVTASDLTKVATGIRNVIGMGFQPGTGDLYFVDNAIDGPNPDGDEPPQAEELNVLPASLFGITQNYGYPDCYVQYRTGAQVGTGCVNPVVTFQPLPNGTALGAQSEGPAQLAFAPASFPNGYNNGVFIGFSGKRADGPQNEENAVVYYDFGTGNYIHFVESGIAGVGHPIGLYSTGSSLYLSDYTLGAVYQINPTAVPEPGSFALFAPLVLGLWRVICRRSR